MYDGTRIMFLTGFLWEMFLGAVLLTLASPRKERRMKGGVPRDLHH